MRISYFVNQYPKISHSFIRREILALERQDSIMHKASRSNGLTDTAKALNHQISKVRYIVEQCFGTLKQRLQFQRSRYRTTAGV